MIAIKCSILLFNKESAAKGQLRMPPLVFYNPCNLVNRRGSKLAINIHLLLGLERALLSASAWWGIVKLLA